MAVVQISRIQVRRGQKNAGTGMPQLASGELGWAVDTQELYIGNGSVSEGAPAVGNTQLLTEHSDIFSVIGETYEYKANDSSVLTGKDGNHPIKRTLQDRLDDQVNGAGFGIVPGSNVTRELQNALLQLFDSQNNRVELIINPGNYTLTDTIYVPSNVSIRGAGKGKTIFNTSANPAFQIIHDDATVSIDWSNGATNLTSVTGAGLSTSTVSNQPRNIKISNFTVTSSVQDVVIFQFDASRDTELNNLSLEGDWVVTDAINPLLGALNLTAFNSDSTINNKFIDCDFKNFGYAFRTNNDLNRTVIKGCTFDTLGRGIVAGEAMQNVDGSTNGPSETLIEDCKFSNILKEAILLQKGLHNTSRNNRFELCGNNGAAETSQAFNVIKFVDATNKSENDWFKRSDVSKDIVTYNGLPYKAEVAGPGVHTQRRTNNSLIIENQSNTTRVEIIRLPGDSDRKAVIDYTYVSKAGDAKRSGTMTVYINNTLNTAEVVDDAEINGGDAFDATNLPKLRFFGKYVSTIDTAFITYTNFLDERQGATYDGADFNYTITYVN